MYLHVGAPKTGTTFLQSVLWASRAELRRQGLTLPMRRVEDHVHTAQDVRELYEGPDGSPRSRGALDRFAAALQHVRTSRALFSMEIIAPATPEQIDRCYGALAEFDIHVVITARDLARQIPSGWQQRVKRRVRRSYEEYLQLVLDDPALSASFWRSQHIAEVAARWGARLPPERVHVVTVPPPGTAPGTLLARFCSVIGVDPDRVDTESADANASLAIPQAELLRRVNEVLAEQLEERSRSIDRLAKRYLAAQVLAGQSGPPLRLPARYADRVRDLSARIASDIAAAGYHVVGDLADLEPTLFADPDDRPDSPDQAVDDAAVAEAGARAVATMFLDRHADLELIADLRRRLGEGTGEDETWTRKQRRRLSAVREDPSLLLDRLPRPGR